VIPAKKDKALKNKYIGKWRIERMELWDPDYIDLVVQGHVTFKRANKGSLQFGAIDCDLDCRIETFGSVELIQFSFIGEDEGDTVSGRGWALIGRDGRLMGKILFHFGDESQFLASKSK
jgi:hypothetical protein